MKAVAPPTVNPCARVVLPVEDYDLGATLSSGQAFRWTLADGWWQGVISGRWVRLRALPGVIEAEAAPATLDWSWLEEYLQTRIDFPAVVASFPGDEAMLAAVASCRGLRLLRQEPWECLASFVLSSNKQIVQIRQMVAALCERFGETITGPDGVILRTFPSAERLADCSVEDLRACKLGYRAPYLWGTARKVAHGEVNLRALAEADCAEAREALLTLPGVGRKVADCALLFAYGFQEAFPVDVWVERALMELYFKRKRNVTPRRLHEFSARHFGPNGGYAQQYLFHYMRTGMTRGKAA